MKTCPFCGRELQGVVAMVPGCRPSCGRASCLMEARNESTDPSLHIRPRREAT